MTTIIPISTTRSSDILVTSRLLAQLQSDQKSLLRVQNQLSTGRRIFVPSDDTPAALRAVSLQRLLEEKQQFGVNLEATSSFLGATDSALANVANVLSDVRGLAVSSVDAANGPVQREAASAQIQQAIGQLLSIGNQQFRGRHLFAGAKTDQPPFQKAGEFIAYLGNEKHLQSFADLDVLLTSNSHGNEVFGAISAEKQGSVDLQPVLTSKTRLSSLHNGAGISRGSFSISDGINSRTVDISGAETIGDVIRLIEANPPSGRVVTARLTAHGLQVEIDEAGGGTLAISEVGRGTTALELGIRAPNGNGTLTIVGDDLNPRLTSTTLLSDLFGVRASALVKSAGINNDLFFQTKLRGAEYNGITVQFVDDGLLRAAPGLPAGSEVASFSESPVAAQASLRLDGANNDLILTAATPGAQLNNVRIDITTANIGDAANVSYSGGVLTIEIDAAGQTTVGMLQAELAAEGTFTASFDTSLEAGVNPAATITQSAAVGLGNTGNSGGEANTIFVRIRPGQTNAQQVIDAIENNAVTGELVSVSIDPKDIVAGSTTLGKVDVNATAVTTDGSGVEFDQDSGIQLVNGGQIFQLDFQSAETVEDLLNIVNGAGANVLAEINGLGNGINIRSRLSGSDFFIGESGGLTAAHLGLRTFTENTLLADLNHGLGVQVVDGADFAIRRNDGTELEIDISGAQTISDVLDAINNHPGNVDPNTAVVARLAAQGGGIELVDDNPASGEQLTVIKGFSSSAAIDLGLIAAGETTSAAGQAAAPAGAVLTFSNPTNTAIELTAVAPGTALDGVEIVFQDTLGGNVASAQYFAGTKQLVIDIDATQTDANAVIGAILADGTFSAALSTASDPTNNGQGVIGDVGPVATTSGGAAEIFTGADANPLATKGVFNTLIRLNEAILDNDLVQIEHVLEMLDEDFNRLVFARSDAGFRGQDLDLMKSRLQDEQIELQAALSNEIDVDFAAAATEFSIRQASLEASLQTMAQTFRLTLLDFL